MAEWEKKKNKEKEHKMKFKWIDFYIFDVLPDENLLNY